MLKRLTCVCVIEDNRKNVFVDLVYFSVERYVEKNDKLVYGGVDLVCLGIGRYIEKNNKLIHRAWKNGMLFDIENNVTGMINNGKNWYKAERGYFPSMKE